MERVGNVKMDNKLLVLPVAENIVISENTMAALNEDGYAVPAEKAENLIIAGRVERYVNNSTGEAGSEDVEVLRGTFVWKNDGSIKRTDILKTCYIADAATVTLNSEGSSTAGVILAVEGDYVTVDMEGK